MSAFEEASRKGRGAAKPARQASGFGGAFDAAASSSSSRAPSSSYQNSDRLYTTTCDNVEKELRKLTTYVTTLKKQVEQVGTAKDSQDLRVKM